MTRAQLKTLMRSWLDDEAAGYFNDSDCNNWLNMAQRRVQHDLLQAGQNWYEKAVETSLVVGQADYLLPSDDVVLHRIEIVLSGTGVNERRQPLKPITTNQQDLVPISSGTPANYFLKKDRFTISPVPDSALTMRMYYSPMVADMGSDSDTPDIPAHLVEYVAVIAALDGFIKDDRSPANLMAKKADYDRILKQMASIRHQDVSREVVVVVDYDNYGTMY